MIPIDLKNPRLWAYILAMLLSGLVTMGYISASTAAGIQEPLLKAIEMLVGLIAQVALIVQAFRTVPTVKVPVPKPKEDDQPQLF